ncbi:MAG: hypothetical protein KDA41_20950 [Planctomycetales bacterium]|nr:hypothetical protein [Planctomycetales bacterium]
MILIETLEAALEQLAQQVDECTTIERQCICEINRLSADDRRGQTPELSQQIQSLDAERAAAVAKRRVLQAELSAATTLAHKAAALAKKA